MILVINTSGNGIDLVLDEKYIHVDAEKQSTALPATVINFMKKNNAQMSDLTAIGVVVGPGSFTGIRMGIAYAKGLGIGLNIPVVPVNAFELYLHDAPDAFVAIDSGRGDFFVASKMHAPCTMNIDELEVEQMKCPQTVGHKPFDLKNAVEIIENKIKSGDLEPAIPLYLRPSYAEK
ncbi:MAG: tRNA (adenosine(37)-N6)-threonylcarbamoyltransferase complex dimerization subunit type 1 TsaB [Alphaproteobacteria bacterium]|nr:tRNA (adenosine(37)-N6)-threonylcarbamoyltransferase complex dimerization subunit type 1 TsaB [Alphaproteobacteria bacterium]